MIATIHAACVGPGCGDPLPVTAAQLIGLATAGALGAALVVAVLVVLARLNR